MMWASGEFLAGNMPATVEIAGETFRLRITLGSVSMEAPVSLRTRIAQREFLRRAMRRSGDAWMAEAVVGDRVVELPVGSPYPCGPWGLAWTLEPNVWRQDAWWLESVS